MSVHTWWPRLAAVALPCYGIAVYWLDRSTASGPLVDAILMPALLAMAFGEPLLKRFGLTADGWFNMPTAAGCVLLIALYAAVLWLIVRLIIAWR